MDEGLIICSGEYKDERLLLREERLEEMSDGGTATYRTQLSTPLFSTRRAKNHTDESKTIASEL